MFFIQRIIGHKWEMRIQLYSTIVYKHLLFPFRLIYRFFKKNGKIEFDVFYHQLIDKYHLPVQRSSLRLYAIFSEMLIRKAWELAAPSILPELKKIGLPFNSEEVGQLLWQVQGKVTKEIFCFGQDYPSLRFWLNRICQNILSDEMEDKFGEAKMDYEVIKVACETFGISGKDLEILYFAIERKMIADLPDLPESENKMSFKEASAFIKAVSNDE